MRLEHDSTTTRLAKTTATPSHHTASRNMIGAPRTEIRLLLALAHVFSGYAKPGSSTPRPPGSESNVLSGRPKKTFKKMKGGMGARNTTITTSGGWWMYQ